METEIKLTPEAQEQLAQLIENVVDAFDAVISALADMIQKIMTEIQRVAIELARWFLMQRLLEWKIPSKVAGWIAQNVYWPWAVKWGYAWAYK